MNRAYSLLEIKSVDEDAGIIEGLATTPTTDRMGDVVDPKGAKFKLPIPLLWQHSSKDPIGHVISAKVTDAGIAIKAQILRGVLPEIDRAWTLIKSGLVRGLSIGFRAIDDPKPIKGTFGMLFDSWEWLELSAVTIPANAEASIQSIKSAYGAASGRAVVRLNSPLPGASGITTEAKGNEMKTIQERMTAWEAKRQATDAARAAIMDKAEKDGDRTLSVEEKQEYGSLTASLNEVDDHLGLLRDEEMRIKATATEVTQDGGTPEKATKTRGGGTQQPMFMKDRLDPGIEFARYVKCHLLSNGVPQLALAKAKSMYPDAARLQNIIGAEANYGDMISKANVLAGTSTDATWAGALVQYQDMANLFLEYLRPQTIIGKFGTNGIPSLQPVPFNARIPAQTSGGTAYWVGEGKPKPLTKFDFTNFTMATTKVAAIAVLTEEVIRLATPSADLRVRNALTGCLIERLDRDFIDPDFAGSAGVSPASITYGQPTAAASGTINSAVIADVGAAMDTFLQYNMSPMNAVWIMSASTAMRLAMAENALGQKVNPGLSMAGGTFQGLPVIVSQYAAYAGGLSPGTGNLLVLVNASEIFLADDGQVGIDASREASLQMLDNPTNDSVTPTATTVVSMYQTDSIAFRAHRFINWKVARTGAVAVITGAAYSGLAA